MSENRLTGVFRLDVFNTEAHPFKAPAASEIPDWTGSPTPVADSPFIPIAGQLPKVSAIPGLPDL